MNFVQILPKSELKKSFSVAYRLKIKNLFFFYHLSAYFFEKGRDIYFLFIKIFSELKSEIVDDEERRGVFRSILRSSEKS